MSNLDEVRKLWLEEQPLYVEYGRLIEQRLSSALRSAGIWIEITSRAKSIESLIKKLIKKPHHTYESVPDKVGVRVIVRYRSDLDVIIPLVTEALHCGLIDRKNPIVDGVGYISVHVDFVRLLESDPDQRRFPVNRFWAELQLRTQAQHLWSEMSHDSIYKNESTIVLLSDDVKRRVNLMAGQIEIADREFDRLASETKSSPEAQLLRFLEPYYFRLATVRFDIELSLLILRTLLPLFHDDLPAIEAKVGSFLESHTSFLEKKYTQAQEDEALPVSALFFQPEALLIYERLADDDIGLRNAWQPAFPEKELEKLARDFGFSLQ